MSRIRGKDTKPEMIVRRLVHAMGFRYRLHVAGLPGSPDLVLPRHHKIIFVHGCFWHRHRCKRGCSSPSSNPEFWQTKFDANVKRDKRDRRQLRRLGWGVLVVWECQTASKNLERLRDRIAVFLGVKL